MRAAALQRQAHGIGMRHVAHQRLEDSRLQFGGAVAVEQPQQADVMAPRLPPRSAARTSKSRLAGTAVRSDGGAVLTGGALALDQGLDMRRILDLRAVIVAARMAGERSCAIDDAHLVRIGQHRQRAPHVGYAGSE